MKKIVLPLLLCISVWFIALGGPEKVPSDTKTVIEPTEPRTEFFRAHEWELSLWGTYVFSANPGHNNVPNDDPFSPDLDPQIIINSSSFDTGQTVEPQNLNPNERVNLGPSVKDTFLGRDNSWGGGVDLKYFFSKYFGVGVEGFLVDTETQLGGGGLATFTARYPIGRFSPYVWLGGGALAGGGQIDRFFYETHTYSGGFVTDENEFFRDEKVNNDNVFFDGQLGIGIQVRITRHVGIMTDFAWNFIMSHDNGDHSEIITSPGGTNYDEGTVTFPNNTAVNFVPGASGNKDFGMVRFGLTIAY